VEVDMKAISIASRQRPLPQQSFRNLLLANAKNHLDAHPTTQTFNSERKTVKNEN
jgi:hypothetical protein